MLAPWKESYGQPRQHIKKQRHYFANNSSGAQEIVSAGLCSLCRLQGRLFHAFILVSGVVGNPWSSWTCRWITLICFHFAWCSFCISFVCKDASHITSELPSPHQVWPHLNGCESWTIKKAEHRSINVFELWCQRRLLRVPWTARRSNQSTLREISPEKAVSSDTQSCPTLCDPMDYSTSGLPVHHQLPESTQTHVHRVGDAIQLSHPLSSSPPPALNLPQHQGLF